MRPVLVVQTDRAIPHSPHTILVPFTSRIRHKLLPSHVAVPAGEGRLTIDSAALYEPIRVIDHLRLQTKLGVLPAPRMQDVDAALRVILGL